MTASAVTAVDARWGNIIRNGRGSGRGGHCRRAGHEAGGLREAIETLVSEGSVRFAGWSRTRVAVPIWGVVRRGGTGRDRPLGGPWRITGSALARTRLSGAPSEVTPCASESIGMLRVR